MVLIIFGTMKLLSSYTDHSGFVLVPDFKGQTMTDLEKFVQGKNVSFKIIDSIYDPKEKPGIVIRQDPEENVKVKHNRTIYLYVTGMVAPQIQMPKLVDRSERQARLIILTYGLKLGKIVEKAADCNGCVLSQSARGVEIEAGKSIKKGSVIDLVIGRKDAFFNSSDSTKTGNEEPNFDDETE